MLAGQPVWNYPRTTYTPKTLDAGTVCEAERG